MREIDTNTVAEELESMESVEPWKEYFPYKPRHLQEIMIKVINRFILSRTHVVMEASTGIGKTIVNLATMIPYARQKKLKIIYTARTHSQIDRVMEELQEISKLNPVSGIALRGRDAFCINELVKKYARNNRAVQIMCKHLKSSKKCKYFTNMSNEAILKPIVRDLIQKPATAEYIFDMATSAEVCPAEISRKILPHVEVIACSYLYIFDDVVRKSFLEQIDANLEDLIVIIDEAHNLPDMVNNISSDNLSSFTFNRAIREADTYHRDNMVAFMEQCNEELFKWDRKLKLYQEEPVDAAKFLEEVELKLGSKIDLDDDFFEEMKQFGEGIRVKKAKRGQDPQSSLGRVGEFFALWYHSIGKKDYVHSIDKKRFADGKNEFVTLNLSALDASLVIHPVLSKVHLSLSVTGTLGNPEAFTQVTGLNKLKHKAAILPSPYDVKNVKTLVTRELTTLYKSRGKAMYSSMVKAISAVIDETPANVGLFTPSYKILDELIKHGLERYSSKDLMIAKSGMSSKENDRLVERFKRRAERGGAVLCTVLGGRSSEGADFPGDTMNAVIVVGIPYAPPTVTVKAEIEYLDTKFPGNGRKLAYEIPAINRAAQAAGRPVRSLSDTALIVFMDYRYSFSSVSDKLPEWIRTSIEVVDNRPQLISRQARIFFNTNQ